MYHVRIIKRYDAWELRKVMSRNIDLKYWGCYSKGTHNDKTDCPIYRNSHTRLLEDVNATFGLQCDMPCNGLWFIWVAVKKDPKRDHNLDNHPYGQRPQIHGSSGHLVHKDDVASVGLQSDAFL